MDTTITHLFPYHLTYTKTVYSYIFSFIFNISPGFYYDKLYFCANGNAYGNATGSFGIHTGGEGRSGGGGNPAA